MKINRILIPKITFITICFFMAFGGWELHVFKLWVADVLNRAKMCDETRCQKIMNMAVELEDYNLPVDNIIKPKPKKGEKISE